MLGKRVDKSAHPLRFYAYLELFVTLAAALSPLLLWIVRTAYLALGGQSTLGEIPATILRLLLATVVLGLPIVLMGGTLPAAARAVVTENDPGRGK